MLGPANSGDPSNNLARLLSIVLVLTKSSIDLDVVFLVSSSSYTILGLLILQDCTVYF